MNITSSHLENVTEISNISAVAEYGTGLLTAIVTGFIEIFGCKNKMYANKVEKARDAAIGILIEKASNLNADGIMNLRIQMSNRTILVYGTAYALDVLPEL